MILIGSYDKHIACCKKKLASGYDMKGIGLVQLISRSIGFSSIDLAQSGDSKENSHARPQSLATPMVPNLMLLI